MKGTSSLVFKAKQHAARPPDQRSDVLRAGWARTFSSVWVLRQHQERDACVSCHLSSSLVIPRKRILIPPSLGLVQQIWGERHSGARHTPRPSFASLLECCWGAGAAWDGAMASLAGKMHIWCYSLLCKLSKQLDTSHVGSVEPNPLAPHQALPFFISKSTKSLMLIHSNSIIV